VEADTLREVEVLQGQGLTVGGNCRKIGVADHIYYRWKKEDVGLNLNQAKGLKELPEENVRLKKLAAEAELDKAIL
jgi:transposase-like protein